MSEEFTKVKILKDEDVKDEELKNLFQGFIDKSGKVPEWARVMGNRPQIAITFTKMFMTIMGPGLVEQDNKWKMGYKISHINECKYCVSVVENMLKKLGVSDEDIKHVITNTEEMKDDEKAAVKFAEAGSTCAYKIDPAIMEELKKYYNDEQIVELTSVIGLFNFINRFNDALGVLPE